MTCEEFKNAIVDRFDTGQDGNLSPECTEHMEHCPECSRYADEMCATAARLQFHLPARKRTPRPRFIRRLMSAAAALLIFLGGVLTGLSNLFSTSVNAETSRKEFLSNAARHLSNVGNYFVEFETRSTPYETFSHLDATLPFIRMSLRVMHQNDSLFWRMEKENGRTITFDGSKQILWNDNSIVVGNRDVGFLDQWLHPDNLLRRQTMFTDHSDNRETYMKETDSTITVTSEGILRDLEGKDVRYRIENVFTKATNLLQGVRIWKEHKGNMVLVLRSTECRYNVALTKEDILLPPDRFFAVRQEAEIPSVTATKKQARQLRKETAVQAAERILNALISRHPEQAAEALYYYQPKLSQLMDAFQGCTVSSFSKPETRKDYSGVIVFFHLTCPDGQTLKKHIALRRDNKYQFWILDGGL